MHVKDNSKRIKQRNKNLRIFENGDSNRARFIYSWEGCCKNNMEPTGQDKGHTANPNDPVFLTMILPKGKKSEPENKAGKMMMKGNAEGMTVKGKVRKWAAVGGAGKATTEERQQPLHHTMEAYGKEKNRSQFSKQRRKRR